jgi:hypothetical protein
MNIIGFNFTKLDVQTKETQKSGKININSNVMLKKVEKKQFNLGNAKQGTVRFDFDFDVQYEPDIGSIKLSGNLLLLTESKKADEIAKSWKDNKNVPAEVTEAVMNTILSRSNIQALILSQYVNLPPPIKLPRVKASDKK